ncbi:MAG TPA: arylsulfatase [Acidimicrobiia bacterium]|jgi:arylsulfatase|nr:arylsulfatase [Acidimicrobiia bacterium]
MEQAREFGGVIGPTWRESTPWWPPEPAPPDGAPNVALIVLDDVGFAQIGCYGSDIATPNIDRLASGGVRFSNFHTTALCSPTRACLLTGRNHHSNGMARVADLALGYPGYSGRIPRENFFLSQVLATVGYAPYAVGKWHLTPEDETHMAAPRNSWPLGRGFQRWYGFHGGETHQFVPSLYHDNHTTLPPRSVADGYHLSEDLADRAIEYLADLRAVDGDQPFFLYFATGACHSPHHAPAEYIERYHGQFDDGWDAWRDRTFARQLDMGLLPRGTRLSPRPAWVPAWTDLKPEDQRVAARFMECFAGFLTHADAQIGRVLDSIDSVDGSGLDDTLVILVSDNGASSEGGVKGSINDARLWNGMAAGRRELRARIDELGTPTAHNNYPWGWTMAGNTPFKRWKREVHEGGIADPCIVHWPGRIRARGEIRHQFAHAIDVAPTVLELIGIEAPTAIEGLTASPIEGTSFAYLLDDDAAAGRHTTQYFEMLGSRGIYHDGWKAVTFKPLGHMYDDGVDPDAPFEDDVWELYHVAEDLSECDNLADAQPDKVQELVDLWWEQARAYKVLPLDNRPLAAIMNPRPRRAQARNTYTYRPHGALVPEDVAVNVRNRTHSIRADVTIADGADANGVLLAIGNVLGGFSLYVLGGRLHYVHNLAGTERSDIPSARAIGSGDHVLQFDFVCPGDYSGHGTLRVDGEVVGEGDVARFTPARFGITGGGLTCGYELGPAVGEGYEAPFRFDQTLHRVVVTVDGIETIDAEAKFESIMSEQ